MQTREQSGRLWIELATIAAFCAFLFFFGLGAIGLAGADEPRYAQIAREMVARHDWITPVLYGRPWLEKPVLYYWEAMVAYKLFGVADWVARLPSAVSATTMVFAILWFLRRCCFAAALDAALISAATAACIGFSRAASTDMPLAATFTIAMLCWFAALAAPAHACAGSVQNAKEGLCAAGKWLLLAFYGFLALATLAKGPVAPGLAALIVLSYAALTRQWKLVRATLWWPGILLFFAVAVPWYIAVQHANPEFAREFFLQQNLARFGTNLYRHKQPFWYYVPVLAAALAPWTISALAAFATMVAKVKGAKPRAQGSVAMQAEIESGVVVFLLMWALVRVLFFSISQSKLPGYILPAIPAWTMLLAIWIAGKRTGAAPGWPAALAHSVLAAGLIPMALILPLLIARSRIPSAAVAVTVATCVAVLFAMALTLRRRGWQMLRFVTLVPVIVALAYLVSADAPALDAKVSARRLAAQITATVPGAAPIAVFHTRREVEYGLAFYLNHAVASYDRNEVPGADHLVVAPAASAAALAWAAAPRRVSSVGHFPAQGLELFWISAGNAASMTH